MGSDWCCTDTHRCHTRETSKLFDIDDNDAGAERDYAADDCDCVRVYSCVLSCVEIILCSCGRNKYL